MKGLRTEPARRRGFSAELIVLVTMVAILFARFLVRGRILLLRDLFCFWYPRYEFYRESLQGHSLPLWNPYTGCGEPHLANPEMAVLYPPNLIFLCVSPTQAVLVSTMLHLVLAGAGVYALARVWRISRGSALLAAIAFTFSSTTITRIEFYPFLCSLAWYPVAVALFALWLRRRTPWPFFAVPLVLCVQLLAGYPEATAMSAGTIALYAVFAGLHAWREKRNWLSGLTPLLGTVGMGTLATLLGMAQILPTWELIRLSTVGSMPVNPGLSEGSVHPLAVFTLFIPSLYGVPGYLGRYWAPSCFEFWLGTFYIGIVPIAILATSASVHLARMGARHSNKATEPQNRVHHHFLFALLALAGLYAMGRYTPFFDMIWHLVPLVQKFRWPAKALAAVVLSLSCLTAITLDALRDKADGFKGGADRRAWLAQWGALAVAAILSLFAFICLADAGGIGTNILRRFFNLDAVEADAMQRIPWQVLGRDCLRLALGAPVAALLIHLHLYRNRWRQVALWALLGLAFVDLMITAMPLLPAGDAEMLRPRSLTLRPTRPDGSLVRFCAPVGPTQLLYGESSPTLFGAARDTLLGGWSLADHAFNIEPTGNFPVARLCSLLGLAQDPDLPPDRRRRILALLNCETLVTWPNMRAYFAGTSDLSIQINWLGEALPRAWVVGGLQVLPTEDEVREALVRREFDPTAIALVSEKEAGGDTFRDLTAGRVRHRILDVAYGVNTLRVTVESDRPALLVVSDTHYPGWEATVNDAPERLMRVNYALRGIRVPAGKSIVHMRFRPRSYHVGWRVSFGTLAALVLAALFIWCRTRWFRSGTPALHGEGTRPADQDCNSARLSR